MAQSLTLSDKSTRIVITVTANAPVLAYTDTSVQRVIDAVDKLNAIRAMSRVEFSILGGGYTNLLSFYPSDIANAMFFRFSNSGPTTESYKIEFSSGVWSQDAISQAKKVKDEFLSLNATNPLTSVSAFSSSASGFSSHPTLSSGLVSYWRMEESSVEMVDSVGANHLTFSGVTSTASGKSGNGVEGTSTGYLERLAAVLGDDASVTFSAWVNPVSPDSAFTSTFGYQSGPGAGAWAFYYLPATNKVYGIIYNSTLGSVDVTSTPALANDALSHVIGIVDAPARTVSVIVNNGAADVSAALAGTDFLAPNSPFRLCSPGPFQTIRMDEVGLWNRRLSASEITSLYNAGAGLFL
jgi:hypothetical protein